MFWLSLKIIFEITFEKQKNIWLKDKRFIWANWAEATVIYRARYVSAKQPAHAALLSLSLTGGTHL